MIWLILAALTAVIAWLDHVSGYDLSFSIFYLLPVGLAAWYLQGTAPYFVCVACAVIWGIVDFTSGRIFANVIIPVWNAGVRGVFFAIFAALLDRLQGSLQKQETLAQLDGLTGILNARAFKQRCSGLTELSARNHRPFALGYIDIDNFKTINDTLGHSVGDEALKSTAETLAKRLRASDVCARLGGDEFAVLLPETDMKGAEVVFRDVHRKLMNFAGTRSWPIGFSIGVAVFHLNKGTPDEIIQQADELMYQAKKSGMNSIRFQEFDRLGR